MSSVRVTQQAVEHLRGGGGDLRVTQQAVEVLRAGGGDARVTQQAVESLRGGGGQARVTQQAVEVLYPVSMAITVTPPAGVLVFVGQAGNVLKSDAFFVAPAAGVLRWVGRDVCALELSPREPAAGVLLFVGQRPSMRVSPPQWVGIAIDPPGVLRFEGQPVVVAFTNQNFTTSPSYTRPIRRLRQAPHLSDAQGWLYYARLQLDLESGVGLDTGLGEDPQVMLQWSDDGGKTWSSEHWVSAGREGAYTWRAQWRRLGRSRDRVFRVVLTDPVKATWIDAFMDLDRGTS